MVIHCEASEQLIKKAKYLTIRIQLLVSYYKNTIVSGTKYPIIMFNSLTCRITFYVPNYILVSETCHRNLVAKTIVVL